MLIFTVCKKQCGKGKKQGKWMRSKTHIFKKNTRNSVGVKVDEEMKGRVVEVVWKSARVILW